MSSITYTGNVVVVDGKECVEGFWDDGSSHCPTLDFVLARRITKVRQRYFEKRCKRLNVEHEGRFYSEAELEFYKEPVRVLFRWEHYESAKYCCEARDAFFIDELGVEHRYTLKELLDVEY